MTPQQHYLEAERILAHVEELNVELDGLRAGGVICRQRAQDWIVQRPAIVAMAQVHATLATMTNRLPASARTSD